MTCERCGHPCRMDNPDWPRCPSCQVTYDTHANTVHDSNWRDVTRERMDP